jgi:hypothetical protein
MIVFIEGRRVEIKEPTPATLKKFGITLNEWKEIVSSQGYRCPICTNVLEKRTNIDHFHVRHWTKMKSENRKLYIRGVVDWFCNRYYLGRAINIKRARNMVTYLESFEKRMPK